MSTHAHVRMRIHACVDMRLLICKACRYVHVDMYIVDMLIFERTAN